MGKGDRRSRKGKIWSGSFGNSRPHKPDKGKSVTVAEKPKKAEKEKKAAPTTAKKTTKTKAKAKK